MRNGANLQAEVRCHLRNLKADEGDFRDELVELAERGDAEGAGNVEVRPRVFEIDDPITFVVKLDNKVG